MFGSVHVAVPEMDIVTVAPSGTCIDEPIDGPENVHTVPGDAPGALAHML